MSSIETGSISFKVVVFFIALICSQCTNSLVYGDRTGFNLAVIADGAKGQPIIINAGLKREVGAFVPSSSYTDDRKAAGDAVSMQSSFKMRATEGSGGPFDRTIVIASAFITGPPTDEIPSNRQDVTAELSTATNIPARAVELNSTSQ